MKKQIVCIHWGKKYGPLYINRLYSMVEKNITGEFRFVCFCEENEGVNPAVECFPIPELEFDLPKNTKGIWRKSSLWHQCLGDLSGAFLFLDLDLVITSNLDCFFEFGEENDVVLAPNPSNPLEKLGQTSVYRAPVGKLYPLLKKLSEDPQTIADKYRYEQRFVSREAPDGIKFWPKSWVRHFRHHCRRPFPVNYFLPPKEKAGCRIVIFPGDLSPQNAIDGVYDDKQTKRSPAEHIKEAFSSRRKEGFLSHLRHYILPTEWIKKYWQ